MADKKKKTEPVQAVMTEDLLRKMAASGKSLPSVQPALPPEERME
jgi:hypothetical protein